MEILVQAKNGVVIQTLKEREELTPEEIEFYGHRPYDRIERYKNFIVHKNKKDEITRVKGREFTEEERKKIYEEGEKAREWFLAVQATYAPSEKQKKKAKEKLNKEFGYEL